MQFQELDDLYNLLLRGSQRNDPDPRYLLFFSSVRQYFTLLEVTDRFVAGIAFRATNNTIQTILKNNNK